MFALVKLATYLIGAIALLFVLTPSKEKTASTLQEETRGAETVAATTTALFPVAPEATNTAPRERETKTKKEAPETAPLKPMKPTSAAETFTTLIPAVRPLDTSLPPHSEEGEMTTNATGGHGETEQKNSSATTSAVKPSSQVSWNEINKKTRAALVNIVCTTIRSGSFEPLSGSGVIIDPHGVILTNAHVAEYFLLKDYLVPDFVQCVIRTGEPARNRYKARLLYISPLWIQANYQKIRLAEATGTGEHDFAFLLITESVNPSLSPLPESFPSLAVDFTDETLRAAGSQTLIAAYPAGFLSGINIQKDFYPSSSVVTIGSIFTFREKTADIFSVTGSLLAQQGSSGGAAVSNEGELIGLIVTATGGATTGERVLHAITPSHIARSFRADTGDALDALLGSDLAATADNFNENVAPALTKLLEDTLQKK